jgi:acetyl esterase/lipase
MNNQATVYPLWPNLEAHVPEVEFANGDVENLRFLRNVTVPTLTAFLPERSISTGTAMIVCPGGGFHVLAIDYEGLDVARWLCERGIAAFVLKYRLLPTPADHGEYQAYMAGLTSDLPHLIDLARHFTPTMLADGQQALNGVRQRANEWGIQPGRVGMMGFSAGAYLTLVTTLQAENPPDFAASIYGGLWQDVENPGPLPPLFIAVADDDPIAVEPSLQVYSGWRKAKSPVEMHIYAQGGHGFAFRNINPAAEGWIERLHEWMQVQGFVP